MGEASARHSDEERKFLESYRLGQFLNRGTFGHVFSCWDRVSKKEYACKMVLKSSIESDEDWQHLRTEASLLRILKNKHEGILQLKNVLETPQAVYLVSELCRGGDLFELLQARGRLPEPSCMLLFRQLASAVSFLHSLDIVHRDIKPENILLDIPADCLYHMTPAKADDVLRGLASSPVKAKLADFGLSALLTRGQKLRGFVGSLRYSAPEELSGKEHGTPADVWSLGVVLYTMLSGCLPFSGKDPEDSVGLKRAIFKGKPSFGVRWSRISNEAKDLVARMLELDETKRPTAKEILAHPWLQGSPSHSVNLDLESEPMSPPRSQLFQPWATQEDPPQAASLHPATEGLFGRIRCLDIACW